MTITSLSVIERKKIYGSPKDNFELIAQRWSNLLNIDITPAQVVLMMLDLKIVRMQNNPDYYNNLMDDKRYAACLGEVIFCEKDV